MTKKLEVYNLEFPSKCPELNIFGYRFTRVLDYETQITALHHIATSYAEFRKEANAGTHAITAVVEIPDEEKKPALPWANQSQTALVDVLWLLSMFTGREVFIVAEELLEEGNFSLLADPRKYQ